jgi:uncharacterized protein YjbI with pentapeptide repeats
MPLSEDVTRLRRGVKFWNAWRRKNRSAVPILSGTVLSGMDLREADFRKAQLQDVYFNSTNLEGADLREAGLQGADFRDANLRGADLTRADLRGAHLKRVDLREATLEKTDLRYAALLHSDLSGASMIGCAVFGTTAWDLTTEGLMQRDLVISDAAPGESGALVTLDELEAAQLVHLLMSASKVSRLIDAVNSKLVLILGRFKRRRKKTLDAIREHIRQSREYVPIMFDFEKPVSQDYVEPVITLAQLSRFIIADVTDPKIVLEELVSIMSSVAVPVRPIMQKGAGKEPTTLYNLRAKHRFLLDTYFYASQRELLENLESEVIAPAESLVKELQVIRRDTDPLKG